MSERRDRRPSTRPQGQAAWRRAPGRNRQSHAAPRRPRRAGTATRNTCSRWGDRCPRSSTAQIRSPAGTGSPRLCSGLDTACDNSLHRPDRRNIKGVTTAMPMTSPTKSGSAELPRSLMSSSLVGNSSPASRAATTAAPATPVASNTTHVADVTEADVQPQISAGDDGCSRVARGNDCCDRQYDRPGQVGVQHEDLGDHDAGKQHQPVGRAPQDDQAERHAEARVPGRYRHALVLVDEAHPFEAGIGKDAVHRQRLRRTRAWCA